MGSHGTKAIAAAALGAHATCVEISPVNAAYGAKVAAAAGVEVTFVVADVLQLPPEQLAGRSQAVCWCIMILHIKTWVQHHKIQMGRAPACRTAEQRYLSSCCGCSCACRWQCADKCFSDLLYHAGTHDVVLLELGVLHYFIDLAPLLAVVKQLLRPGGRLLLREFHPVSTKLIKNKAADGFGDYFSKELVVSSVAYSKHSTPDHRNKRLQAADAGVGPAVQLRQWGLGEVVTSVCESGLILSYLEEGPTVKLADQGLPKLFTLVAVKS